MEKSDKLPYVIVGILVLMLFGMIGYIYFNANPTIVDEGSKLAEKFPAGKFMLYLFFVAILLAGVAVFIYFIVNRKKEEFYEMNAPKELVSVMRAQEIWMEEFLQDNNIPFMELDDLFVPIEEGACNFRDTIKFSDPSMQTADMFLAFEVDVRAGRTTGMLVAVLRLDLGEEYIRDNWNERMEWNTTLNRFNLQNKRYPLTNARAYNERVGMKRIELFEAGFSDEEIRSYVDPFAQSARQQFVVQQPKKKRKPIEAPAISDVYGVEEEEEGASADDIKDDIDEYRRQNQ